MNALGKYFRDNPHNFMHKWNHYFEIYDRHFSRFRNTDVHVLEVGVYQGGSLQMWKNYFGPKCRIYGIDINPECKSLEEDQIRIFIGDQEKWRFLKSVASAIPRIDILIDDGGHTMKQQYRTFRALFPDIDANGVYLCEDLHTSYWPEWGGGYRKPDTFIERSKNFIDELHAWHSRSRRLKVSTFTRSAHSLHYYDSVLVIEKRPTEQPFPVQAGKRAIPDYPPRKGLFKRIAERLNRKPSR